jgi:riboflavin biosynthesis pyrimidine reductase
VATSEPGSVKAAFDVLFEANGLPRFDLPEALRSTYGDFGLPARCVVANFVASLDGVVALSAVPKSSSVIGGGHPSDRFVVALLRAAVDAVVIGAGTYRQHAGPWTAAKAYPDGADAFAALRTQLGLAAEPMLVIVTRSGNLGPPRPYLGGAMVVTNRQGAKRLAEQADAGAEVVALEEEGSLRTDAVIELLHGRGHGRILTEGGPDLMGELLRARVVDELFLTESPVLFGGGGVPPPATLAGSADLSSSPVRIERLLSVRRAGDYLFLRYSLGKE